MVTVAKPKSPVKTTAKAPSKAPAKAVKKAAAKRASKPTPAPAPKATQAARKVTSRKTVTPNTAKPVVAAAPAAPLAKDAKPKKLAKDKATKGVEKAKKPKMVRDSFTIPKAEYEALHALKLRAAQHAKFPKKSELLRAGIKALTSMNDTAFLNSLEAVPALKTGRPAL